MKHPVKKITNIATIKPITRSATVSTQPQKDSPANHPTGIPAIFFTWASSVAVETSAVALSLVIRPSVDTGWTLVVRPPAFSTGEVVVFKSGDVDSDVETVVGGSDVTGSSFIAGMTGTMVGDGVLGEWITVKLCGKVSRV